MQFQIPTLLVQIARVGGWMGWMIHGSISFDQLDVSAENFLSD